MTKEYQQYLASKGACLPEETGGAVVHGDIGTVLKVSGLNNPESPIDIFAIGGDNLLNCNSLKDYLAHHGVKGQKWGVRRYQNEDGTLTAEGRKRLSDDYRQVSKTADSWADGLHTGLRTIKDPDSRKEISDGAERYRKVAEYSRQMAKFIDSQKNANVNDILQKSKDISIGLGLNDADIESLWKTEREKYLGHIDNPYSEYLAHYGVPGMKWGVRNYQNADGSYTAEGAARYWGGTGQRRYGTGRNPQAIAARRGAGTSRVGGTRATAGQRPRTAAASTSVSKPALTKKQLEARRAKRKKVLMVAGGVAVAAALGYAAYKGSTNLRDTMRADVYKNFDTDFKNLHTLNSKYWDAKDRAEYATRSAKRAKDVAEGITRRDAVSAKLAEATGLHINLPSSREAVMRERRSMNEYSNFIRSAEKRGAMNRSISDARKELREAEKKLRTYANTEHFGTSKQYEQLWTQKHTENVQAARKRLNDLLAKRAA